VYLGGSLALAALELLVHIDYERALQEHRAIPVDFDESLLLRVASDSLPGNWAASEGLVHTQALGDAWVRQGASALLAVPSRVVSVEPNYLLNPQHPDAKLIRIGTPQPFRYDPRLLKRETRAGRAKCGDAQALLPIRSAPFALTIMPWVR
jgi:RES domain-containing protein